MKNTDSVATDHSVHLSLGDPEESLPMLLATCVKYIRDNLNTRFVEAGSKITSEQWGLLTVLAQQDGISQLDLARCIHRTEVSVLNLLKKLELKKYVLRQRDPVDARYKRVFLTASGRRIQRDLIPVVLENRARLCNRLSDDDINNLKRIINIMIENTKDH